MRLLFFAAVAACTLMAPLNGSTADLRVAQSVDARDGVLREPGAAPLNEMVIKQKNTALVLFRADWCPPCIKIASDLIEAARSSSIPIIEIDVDANPVLTGSFSIQSIPTLLLFSKGVLIERKTGNMSATEIRALVEKLIKARDALAQTPESSSAALVTGREIPKLTVASDVGPVSFSPDGRTALSGGNQETIKPRDAASHSASPGISSPTLSAACGEGTNVTITAKVLKAFATKSGQTTLDVTGMSPCETGLVVLDTPRPPSSCRFGTILTATGTVKDDFLGTIFTGHTFSCQ